MQITGENCMSTDNMEVICKTCGRKLEVKYYKKYGVLLIIGCLIMLPFLVLISHGAIALFVYVLIPIFYGCHLIFEKEKIFYFCKYCKIKFSPSDIENKKKSKQ